MKIGFIGDIHGRVFHTLATIIMWQMKHQQKLDVIIQVGDFGAYPEPDKEMRSNRFVVQDSTELDFSRYIKADEQLKQNLKNARQFLNCPIHFVRGNHEDHEWLDSISQNGTISTCIDDFDLIYYIPDGKVMNFKGTNIAFLGGIETIEKEARSINESAHKKLMNYEPNGIDILVTHDVPYGIGVGFTGEIQGSRRITDLVQSIRPKYLIAGHYHHVVGPQLIGDTIYLGLNILVPPLRRDESRAVQPGSIAVLDTEDGNIELVCDAWLSDLNKSFDFVNFIESLKA